MADEQVIGVAQLRLEADVNDFLAGLNKTAAEVDKTGAAFAKFTEKGEKEGARLLQAQKKIDAEALALTGTATQRQMAAIDERTNRIIAEGRRRGVAEEDLAKLEIAANRRKHEILRAEEERTASSTAAAAAKKGEAVKGVEVKLSAVAHAAKLTGAEFGNMASVMQLAEGALSPWAVGLGAAALALRGYADELQRAEKANREFLSGALEGRQRTRELEIDLAAARGEIADASIAKMEEAVAAQERVVEEAQRKMAEAEGRGMVKFARDLAAGKAEEGMLVQWVTRSAEAASLEAAKAQNNLDAMQKQLRLAKELAAVEKAKEAEAAAKKAAEEDEKKSKEATLAAEKASLFRHGQALKQIQEENDAIDRAIEQAVKQEAKQKKVTDEVEKTATTFGRVEEKIKAATEAVTEFAAAQAGPRGGGAGAGRTFVVGPWEGFGPDPFAKQRISEAEFRAMNAAKAAAAPVAAAAVNQTLTVRFTNAEGEVIGVMSSQGGSAGSIDIPVAQAILNGYHTRSALAELGNGVGR